MMMTLPNGVAHVSFRGGGCFLPVRTPYGRELLVEYVTDLVHRNGLVQVLIDGLRWFVRGDGGRSVRCASCGQGARILCEHEETSRRCLRCAFLAHDLSGDVPVERRQAS